jgi:hypothetical protein
MPAVAETRVLPSIAVHWVRNTILAALVSAAVSLCIYGVTLVTGRADSASGLGAFVVLHACAVVLWAFAGAAGGFLTGAVLRRIVPSLPASTWIVLHAVLAVLGGLGSEMSAMV